MNKYKVSITVFILLFSIFLAGCFNGESSEPADPEQTPSKEVSETDRGDSADSTRELIDMDGYNQSPMLDDMDLPPVEERLPNEPKIANEMPPELIEYEIGEYGGALRVPRTSADVDNASFILLNEPLVNTPGMLGEEVTPNILQDYEVSEDQREFTFSMREGLKWSDGEPVTIEDVEFAIEDVWFNEELKPGGPDAWMRSPSLDSDSPMEFEVIDDVTFKISFDEPYGGFLLELAWQGWRGYNDLLKPKHYLKQFHIDYTPLEEIEPFIEEEGFDSGDWVNLFDYKDILNSQVHEPQAIGFPVLNPYMQVQAGDRITYERNPYYFKVDEAGNQLPYIDEVHSELVQDVEMVMLDIMGGDLDYSFEFATLPRVPLLMENQEQGGYTVYMNDLHRTANDIQLNLTYEDEVWREVVQDVRFREALNLALDKDDIVNTVFYGLTEPSPIQGTTYDLDEANRILDEMGMTVGSDGYRVGPDGERFTIPIEVGSISEDWIVLGELLVEQWGQLDLDVSVRQIDQTLFGSRNESNEIQATVHYTPTPVQWARDDWAQGRWAPLWHQWWNSGGSQGEEPPEDVKELFSKIDEMRASPHEEALAIRDEIRENFAENYWHFIHTEEIPAPVAVNSNIGNYNDSGWGIAHNFGGEMWFFRGEE